MDTGQGQLMTRLVAALSLAVMRRFARVRAGCRIEALVPRRRSSSEASLGFELQPEPMDLR